MTSLFERRCFSNWGRLALASIAAAVLLSGCGGGGGGGGGGGTPTPQTVSIIGQLKDKSTSNVLPNRTVTVQNSGQQGTSDASGNFTITGVPVGTINLSVKDSTGVSDGTAGPINLNSIGGNPKSLGTVILDIYGSGGPPAPPTS